MAEEIVVIRDMALMMRDGRVSGCRLDWSRFMGLTKEEVEAKFDAEPHAPSKRDEYIEFGSLIVPSSAGGEMG